MSTFSFNENVTGSKYFVIPAKTYFVLLIELIKLNNMP